MKKIFTLIIALMGFAGAANAASVNDLVECKHSYVLVCDDYTNNGTGSRTKGGLFGDGFFWDVTGGSVATNKGKVNLAVADGVLVTDEIVEKYGEYGEHLNSLRLKNDQDVIAMKVTAKSKIIIFYQNNGADRYPMFGLDSKPTTNPMDVQGEKTETVNKMARMEWTAPDDMTIYIGGKGGDQFLSFIIVEANEAPGTPTVKVGDMQYDGALYFKEVTCKANPATEEGSTEKIPTVVTYTTDGSTPTAASPVYTAPIKCTKNMNVKFQAFLDFGDGKANDDFICSGADNEGIVSFSFDAPVINNEGGNVTISTGYNNATNYYSYGEVKDAQGDSFTLTEGATVIAYTKIANGDVSFTSKSVTKDVYQGLLAAIKEKKTIAVTAGDVVEDAEATATSTTGPVYKVENGAISATTSDFFVKNLEFAVVKDAAYQIDGKEAYIKMNNTNITFLVAAGDKVNVKVICSKNSCKTLNPDNDESVTTDRKCYVNVSGTTYGCDDITVENGNIIEFELAGGKNVTNKDDEGNETTSFEAADTYYTFQKYSGTGNILISSIEITPADPSGIAAVKAVNAQSSVLYNLAGQRVDANYKGVVIVNGKKMIQK
jgi:hypothetical protein